MENKGSKYTNNKTYPREREMGSALSKVEKDTSAIPHYLDTVARISCPTFTLPPWQISVRNSILKLTKEERDVIGAGIDLDNLQRWLVKVSTAGNQRRTTRIMNFLNKQSQPLQQFQSVIDIIVQTNGAIGSPVWAPIKLVLVMLDKHNRTFDIISEQLERFTQELPLYERYSRIFQSSTLVQDALGQVYAGYLELFVRLVRHFDRAGIMNLFWSMARQFEIDFKDVLAALKNHREALYRYVELETQENIHNIKQGLKQQEEQKAIYREDKDRVKTLKWLSPSVFETECKEFEKNRTPHTCEWVVRREEYRRWYGKPIASKAEGPKFLWIFGNAGCGKTFVSHFVREKLSSAGNLVVFFYFNSKQKDSGKQTAGAFYRTILYQLLRAVEGRDISPKCYSVANNLRRSIGDNNAIPNASLLKTLEDTLLLLPAVYIVIDALDECIAKDQEFVENSVSLCQTVRSLRVVITSRPELQIVARFKKISSEIDLRLQFPKDDANKDIHLYIEDRLQKSPQLSDPEFPEMTEEIRAKLRKNADGMFLYARLMLDLLEKQVTEESIRKKLNCLPDTLIGIYQATLQDIERSSEDRYLMAKRILRWVITAHRPLTVEGLMMALRAEKLKEKENPTSSDLGPKFPDYRGQIQSICFPLIEVLEDSTVQVVHVSVAQYLLGQNIASHISGTAKGPTFAYEISEAHSELALTCLAYLSIQSTNIGDPKGNENGIKNYHQKPKVEDFLAYATIEWASHSLASENHFSKHADAFLLFCQQESEAFVNWIRSRAYLDGRFAIYFCLEKIESGGRIKKLPSPLHIATYFGLSALSAELIRSDPFALELKDATGGTPLHIAAEQNFDTLIDKLLRSPPHEARDNSGKTALHRAAARGNVSPVRKLLEGGFTIDSTDEFSQTPFLLASLSGKKDVVLEFWNRHASLDHKSLSGVTPLTALITHGHEEILEELFCPGELSDAQLRYCSSALITAAREGFVNIVGLLVSAGVDVMATDNVQQTALHKAATSGHSKVIELLLSPNTRAEVDARDHSKRTPLYFAAERGHDDVVRQLLQAGAKVEALDRRNQTVLFKPAGKGHVPVVKCLLKAGVDAKVADLWGRTALHWAARSDRQEEAKLLLQAGADLEAVDWENETALHWAAQNGQDLMVVQLLDAGANIEATDKHRRTALHSAAMKGHGAVIQSLLGHHANVSHRDSSGRSALHWGTMYGYLDGVQSLLNARAEVLAIDIWGRTALHIAASSGYQTLVEKLIAAGANLEAKDNWDTTPLHLAAGAGHEKVVKHLLQAGACPRAVDFKKRTATRIAEKSKHKAVVLLLKQAELAALLSCYSKQTRLHRVARVGDQDAVQQLLQTGVSVDAKDSQNRTALHWAAAGGHSTIVQLLLAAGADIELSDGSQATALHLAVENNHETVVRQCLMAGANVMAIDSRKQIPLHLAAEKGNEDVVRQIIEAGDAEISVAAKDSWSRNPLYLAAGNGHKTIVVQLLRCAAADANVGAYDGQTALLRAARKGYHEIVKELLEVGADFRTTDVRKRTALHLAAKNGFEIVVEQLLEAGANVVAADSKLRTALYSAVGNGHDPVVDILLRFGAQVNTKDDTAVTPLHWAAKNGWQTIVLRLLESGAIVTTQDHLEQTALHFAAKEGHEKVVQVLLNAKAAVNIKDYWQKTPLHWAAENGHEKMVQNLLDAGSDITISGDSQHTPLHRAAENGHESVVKLLLHSGARVDAVLYQTRQTPLHLAAMKGHLAVMRYLLHSGAYVAALDDSDQTPLHYAAKYGHLTVAQLLLEEGADLDAQNSDQKTPVDIATTMNQPEILELFNRHNRSQIS